MIEVFKMLILKLFNLLPDSPFRDFSKSIDMTDYYFINWALPVDICSTMMLGWLSCVAVYYLYLMVKRFVSNIIEGIAKGVSMFAYFA